MMKASERVFQTIRESGMTLKAVSRRSGVPYSTLWNTKTGRREFRINEFFAVCDVLNIDPMEAIREEIEESA